MHSVTVIDDPAVAEASLDPIRARLLAELAEPASASMLAATVGLPRQQVNYHLKTLERHGLVELVEERRKGNMNERIFQATALAYVISPAALGAVAPDPDRHGDQWSSRWLLAIGARLVQEMGQLINSAASARQRLATFGIDTEVTFATAADRAAFVAELAETTARLVARYHRETSPRGRRHRLVVALHPSITKSPSATNPIRKG
jgi:DNA-binding transcriptional ArsR family regulator